METLGYIWGLVQGVGTLYWIAYFMVRFMSLAHPSLLALRKEMWWGMVYVAAPIANIGFWVEIDWWDYVFGPINLLLWWDIWKHDDHDDRWKKRRKKALAKVKQVAGRLVVVPIPHPTT
jgi:hypothetical protein